MQKLALTLNLGMKKYLPTILVLLLTLQVFSAPTVLFNDLDKLIERRGEYVLQKENRIQMLKALATESSEPSTAYGYNQQIYKEYLHYNLDSALNYASACLQISSGLTDFQKDEARLGLIHSYLLAGLYYEAIKELEKVRLTQLDSALLDDYYNVQVFRYRFMESYQTGSELSGNYGALRKSYQDSLMGVLDSTGHYFALQKAERMGDRGLFAEGEAILEQALSTLSKDDHPFAYTAYALSDLYKKDGDPEKQLSWLVQSVESDVRCAVRENMALRELSRLLFETGQIERAYRYVKIALDDATFSNARLRTYETLQILPLIDHAFQDMRAKKERLTIIFTSAISLLFLFLLLAFLIIIKQKRKVQQVNSKLSSLNQELEHSYREISRVNKQLSDSNIVQEEYIARYLKLCSIYIGKIDNYRIALHKKANMGSREDLIKMLKSKEIIDEELDGFYADFDKAFLNLYPGFVGQFNQLLKEDEQIVLKPGELLNTELRVFALIRLGITESAQVSEFLRYSSSTIYNYRTKVRNKARIDRDKFEEAVMQLGKPAN